MYIDNVYCASPSPALRLLVTEGTQLPLLNSMKVIRHAGVDSRMIILDNQACQQMTLHFQLSLQCTVSPITGFVRHTAAYAIGSEESFVGVLDRPK